MTSLLLAWALLGQADAVELCIVANATKIRAYDYLLIKVMVANYGDTPARAPKPYLVYFEKRDHDRSIQLQSGDPRWGFEPILEPSVEFPPGYVSVCYRELIGDGTKEGFHFAKPGKYQIRARIKGQERELVSPWITIDVEDRPRREIDLIVNHMETIYSYLGYRDLSNLNAVSKHEPLKELEGGSIRQTVDRVLQTAEYLKTGEVKGKKLSPSEAFPLLVKGMNRVERDFVLFHLCAHCEKQKDWKELARLRRELLEDSSIRRQIDVRLRYYGLMKPLPPQR